MTTSSQRHRHSLLTQPDINTRQKRIWDLLRHIPSFMFRFLRLLSFVVSLLPAFAVFLYHYFSCDRIAVYYGVKDALGGNEERKWLSRHYLDMYGSRDHVSGNEVTKKKPVVIFLTGGAWIIGYRMWGCLLARALVPFGILVIIPDYHNFPKVNIKGMVDDVDMSIQWVLDHVEEYGGDSNRVVLVGQSAGAHIGGVVVAKKVLDWIQQQKLYKGGGGSNGDDCRHLKSTYSPKQLCGFITTSSPHNLVTMRSVFHRHGLSASVQRSIFGGVSGSNDDDLIDDIKNSVAASDDLDVFELWSPYHLVKKCQTEYNNLISEGNANRSSSSNNNNNNERIDQLKDIFPKLCVIHGTSDKTVPVEEAIEFLSLLSNLQIPALSKMYPGWSHTDPILEKPMLGNHLYHRDVYELVRRWTGGRSTKTDDGIEFYNCNTERDSEHKSENAETIGIVDVPPKAAEGDFNLTPFDETHSILRPICPKTLVEIARVCNPF